MAIGRLVVPTALGAGADRFSKRGWDPEAFSPWSVTIVGSTP